MVCRPDVSYVRNSLERELRLRQVLRGLFTFFRQFNDLRYEEVKSFKAYVLLALHAAEHGCALTVEIADSGEFQSHGPLGLITDFSTNFL